MQIRVDALLSRLGYCTRKEAKKFLKQNEFIFDDNRILNPSTKVIHEKVKLNNEKLDPLEITILLNKPKGYICSHSDAGLLIYSLLPQRWQNRNPKISTIGRLDVDTTGAILLTDNGALNHKLSSPKNNISKIYEVTLERDLKGDEKEIFKSGTLILKGEDKPLLSANLEVITNKKATLEIVEGRYHQVKRMFASLGNRVVELHRLKFKNFEVDDLKEGEYKFIDIN